MVEFGDRVAVADIADELLGFLSGSFRGLHERWAPVNKEVFAIVLAFRRLPFLL